MDNHRDAAADVLVIFGITGDLARRMTFRALYRLERRGLLACPIIGVASDDINTEQLVKHAREAIVDSGLDVDDAVFGRLARRMSYRSGDVRDAALYRSLATEIGGRQRPVYYLEVPPSLFGPVVEQLGAAKLLRDGRLAVEKPLGRDLASARELDTVHAARPPARRPPLPARILGPEEAEMLLRGHPRWQQPWLPEEG